MNFSKNFISALTEVRQIYAIGPIAIHSRECTFAYYVHNIYCIM